MTGITQPTAEYFKDGIWAWNPAGPEWIKLEVNADGHLLVSLADDMDIRASGTTYRAAISAAALGNNTLVVAAGAGLKIKVLGLILVTAGDVDVRLEDGAGGAALTGVMSLASDGNGFVLPLSFPGYHWMQTSDNTLLNLELSANIQVSGCIVYIQEA